MLHEHIPEVNSHKHLGVHLSDNGSWHSHVENIKSKAWNRINIMRRLKFTLDRKSLETIYFSFVRPILEYADVLWDNCTNNEKEELDKIQNEAARIATGATKLASIANLKKETGWEPLALRRRKHKLILFYKMTQNLTPAYLSALVPSLVSTVSRYGLRNSENLRVPFCRTQLYAQSFLPSVILEWNSLPLNVRSSESVDSFKHALNNTADPLEKPPAYYYSGTRRAQVYHTRLRTNCSSLNLTLFQKQITDSPLCHCGLIESADHFFFRCPIYQDIRTKLLNSINPICTATTKLLLYGNTNLSIEANSVIFSAVQEYITKSKRFNT